MIEIRIIETSDNRRFRVRDSRVVDHAWVGIEVKRTKAGYVPKRLAREVLVRKAGCKIIEADFDTVADFGAALTATLPTASAPSRETQAPSVATPRPWFVHDFSALDVAAGFVPSLGDVTVSCDHPATITVAKMGRALTATVDEARANAELIVRAVNCHEDLVDALKDALAGLHYVRQHYHDERTASGDLYGIGFDRVEEKAAAALAKASPPTDAGTVGTTSNTDPQPDTAAEG